MKYSQIKIILNLNLTNEEKAYQLLLMSLSPQMRKIFLCLNKGEEFAIGIKEIKKKTGLQGKNISSQINNIKKKYPIKTCGSDSVKLYYI